MSGERVATGSKKNRGSSAIAASFTWTEGARNIMSKYVFSEILPSTLHTT